MPNESHLRYWHTVDTAILPFMSWAAAAQSVSCMRNRGQQGRTVRQKHVHRMGEGLYFQSVKQSATSKFDAPS